MFDADDVRHADDGGHAARADRRARRGRSASSSRRRISGCAALAQNLWWSWDADTTSAVPRARSRALARARAQPDRAARSGCPIDKLEERAVAARRCTAASTTPTAACRSTCTRQHTWGARHAGVLWARPVAYFSAEFGLHESLPIYSGGLGVLAGDHIKSASDLGIPLVGVGLYYDQGYFRQRLDADGWQHEDYIDVDHRLLPIRPALTRRRAGRGRRSTRAPARSPRASGSCRRRPQHAAAARLGRRRQPPGGPRADRAPLRRRRARPHPPGAAARRRRRPRARRAGHLAGRPAPERGPQRLRGARARAPADGDRRHRRRRGDPPRVAQVVFTTHTPVPAGHDRFSADLVEEHLGPLRDALGMDRDAASWASAASTRTTRGEAFCMTVLALKLVAPRQRGLVAARPGLARDVDAALSRRRARSACRSATSPTACTCRPGSRPQMHQVYDRHLGPDWPSAPASPRLWDDDRRRSTTASCGRRIRR